MSKNVTAAGFAPVMDYQLPLPALDLTRGYSHLPDASAFKGAGGYLEHRPGMYTSEIYGGVRCVHMGVDIWQEAGAPVYAFADGKIFGARDNDNPLDYGPTIVTEYTIGDKKLYALYGHLSRESLKKFTAGDEICKGQLLGELGTKEENGGWIPHLHFQLSVKKPDVPDMPGVVSVEDALRLASVYPDPRMVLGPLYL